MSGVRSFKKQCGLRLLQAGANAAALLLLAVLLAGGLEAAPKPGFGPDVLIFAPSLPERRLRKRRLDG